MGLILLLLALAFPDPKFFRLHPPTLSDYSLTIFVDARHLDYTDGDSFLLSLAKHPSDWSKNGDVGHAWICLKGPNRSITGGQTGEREGLTYTQGVLKGLIKDNPIAYLHIGRQDGAFEKGSGGHTPTFAAKFHLNREQFEAACQVVKTYSFKHYSLTKSQCTSFATLVAKAAGIKLEDTLSLSFPPELHLQGKTFLLWRNSAYSTLSLPTPDRLEQSLQEKVVAGEAEYALSLHQQESLPNWSQNLWENVIRAPSRLWRFLTL